MSFVTLRQGELEFLQADTLGCPHGFSTRLGGVSTGALSSLNLGVHRGDQPRNVLENYRRFGKALGFDYKKLVFTHQTHSDIVRIARDTDAGRGLIFPMEDECDALITNVPGLALAAFTADCTPILLWDRVTGAVAACHAGWRGTAAGIARKTVLAMVEEFGCAAQTIAAAIGPRIGACCFETHRDVPEAMLAALGAEALPAMEQMGEKYHVDLGALNALWLEKAGVSQIDICPTCTCCEPERFWSHRKAGLPRGSLAAIIVCEPKPI